MTIKQNRQQDQTLKRTAIDNYDKVFSITATMVSSMLSFARQSEPARRVRPSTRRFGQTTETAESEESPETLPAGV